MSDLFLNCGNCGRNLKVSGASPGDVVDCPGCGASVTIQAEAAIPVQQPRPAMRQDAQSPPEPPAFQPPAIRYAGFWIRFAAGFIDMFIVTIAAMFIIIASVIFAEAAFPGSDFSRLLDGTDVQNDGDHDPGEGPREPLPGENLSGLIYYSVLFAYFALAHGIFGKTAAKKLFGLKVVKEDTLEDISFLRALWRTLCMFLTFATCCSGFIIAGFTMNKRSLHDFLAGTVVIYDRTRPNA